MTHKAGFCGPFLTRSQLTLINPLTNNNDSSTDDVTSPISSSWFKISSIFAFNNLADLHPCLKVLMFEKPSFCIIDVN